MCYWKKTIIYTFCCLWMLMPFTLANGQPQRDRDKKEKDPKVIVREPKNSPPPNSQPPRDRDRPSNQNPPRDRDRPSKNR